MKTEKKKLAPSKNLWYTQKSQQWGLICALSCILLAVTTTHFYLLVYSMWLNTSKRLSVCCCQNLSSIYFYSLDYKVSRVAGVWFGTAFDITEGKFILSAVIWCVDMVSINPEGVTMIKSCFVIFQKRFLPINFSLIAHKHGMQAAECLFPEIPGWALLYLLPSEVGYMAGRGVPSAIDSSLQRSLRGARVPVMYREANVPNSASTPFLTSPVWSAACILCLCPSSIWIGFSLQTPFSHFLFITLMHSLTKHINTLAHSHTYTNFQPLIYSMLSRQINSCGQKLSAHLVSRCQCTKSEKERERAI